MESFQKGERRKILLTNVWKITNEKQFTYIPYNITCNNDNVLL